MFKILFRKIDGLLFPRRCRHCGGVFQEGLSNILCQSCFDLIEPDGDPRCEGCGLPLSPGSFEGSRELRCAECADRPEILRMVRAYAAYEGSLRLAHHAFKFEGMASLASVLGRCLALAVPEDWKGEGTCLVPVPLSPDRERERGYHPARLLAAEVSIRTGMPWADLLRKIRPTPPQMKLPREERRRNLKGAFSLRGVLPDARILLVDDVVTTGSTLEECARVLKKSGAVEIGAVVLGRTGRLNVSGGPTRL